jgi:hypothetical protein
MLFMNLGPIVSLLLWEVNSTGYQRQSQLLVVSLISMKQCRKVVSQTRRFVLFMVWSKVNERSLQPPKPLHDDLKIEG